MYASGKRFTRRDMIKELSDRLNITKDFAMEMVCAYEDIITDVLECGEDICFRNFMMYKIVTRPALRKYNFQLKDSVALPPVYQLKIQPCDRLAELISKQKVSNYEKRKYGIKDDI